MYTQREFIQKSRAHSGDAGEAIPLPDQSVLGRQISLNSEDFPGFQVDLRPLFTSTCQNPLDSEVCIQITFRDGVCDLIL